MAIDWNKIYPDLVKSPGSRFIPKLESSGGPTDENGFLRRGDYMGDFLREMSDKGAKESALWRQQQGLDEPPPVDPNMGLKTGTSMLSNYPSPTMSSLSGQMDRSNFMQSNQSMMNPGMNQGMMNTNMGMGGQDMWGNLRQKRAGYV